MKKFTRIFLVILLATLFTTSCDQLLLTYVRFQNNSAKKTVRPIWDGASEPTLAPGQITEYREVNPGTHTIKWKDATSNKDLTTTAWPNLVDGNSYTFPYND